ncbi:MAG TPA: hypothetical protein VFJ02_15620 [Vicinamibacterales bacterium]|nr:hypothetical protein [Vicinamibacterales bacterium]
MKFRQSMLSGGVFVAILGALVIFDERVRERFNDLVSGGGVMPWGDRLGDLGGALMSAVKYQSIENAPLLIFATVGAMLFFFMVKT